MTVPTPPSNPVTKVELFRRMPVGGTANLTPKCPSECDPDCDVDCHEAHQVPWKRQHEVGQHSAGRSVEVQTETPTWDVQAAIENLAQTTFAAEALAEFEVDQALFECGNNRRPATLATWLGTDQEDRDRHRRMANAVHAAGLLASTAPPAPQPDTEWGYQSEDRDFVHQSSEKVARHWVSHSYPGMRTLVRRTVGPWTAVTE